MRLFSSISLMFSSYQSMSGTSLKQLGVGEVVVVANVGHVKNIAREVLAVELVIVKNVHVRMAAHDEVDALHQQSHRAAIVDEHRVIRNASAILWRRTVFFLFTNCATKKNDLRQ